MAQTTRREELAELAFEVIDECRTELMMAFRYLNTALWRMPFRPDATIERLGTDGTSIAFSPEAVAERFVLDPNETVRDLLHLVLHCVFRHPFDISQRTEDAWEIACDAVVEGVALEIAGDRWPCARDAEQREALEGITRLSGSLSPILMYRALEAALLGEGAEDAPPPRTVLAWGAVLRRDSHALWARPEGRPDKVEADACGDDDPQPTSEGDASEDYGRTGAASGDEGGSQALNAAPQEASAACPQPASSDRDYQVGSDEERNRAEEAWREIAEEVEAELASSGQGIGSQAGALAVNLGLATRKPVDYADFLRRFATTTEVLKINDDEFDYVPYTFGLTLYGNMPLVEPLEYQEDKRIRDFVIAIDTSGSCADVLVQRFVERTSEILRETEGFARETNVYIVQCDARVQRVDRITSLFDLDRYGEQFQAYGGGGTDFRPVFDYVDRLVDDGKLSDLRGLIYFTDGEGTYPKQMPSYDVAFVFVDDEPRLRRVPPWAMKVVIDSDAVREL